MGHESAVPGLAPRAASTGFDTGLGKRGKRSLALPDLPAHLIERLASNGIHTRAAWRALGRRRFELWGVTRRMVAEIDAAAREANR